MSIATVRSELRQLNFLEMMEVAAALRDRLQHVEGMDREDAATYANALADFAENHGEE